MLHHYLIVLCSYPWLHFKNYSKYYLFWWPCVFLKLTAIPVFPNQGSGELLGSLKSLGVFWDFDIPSINYVVVLLVLSRKYNSSGAYLTESLFLGFLKEDLFFFSLNNFSIFLFFIYFYSIVLLLADILTSLLFQRRQFKLNCVKKTLLWELLGKLLHYLPKITLHRS